MSESTRLSRRSFLRLAGGAVSLTALAACAPVAAPGASTGGGAGEPAEAKSLTVWAHRSFAPPADEVLLASIDKWGEENGVDLEVVAEIDVPVMNDRLVAAIESKQLPDVSAVAGGRIALHYPAGLYADVSALYGELADTYGGFFGPADRMATIDGSQWVIPFSIDTSLMYYRKDILDEKGLALPTNWSEYVEVVKAAQTPPDIYGAGIGLNQAAGDAENTFNLMRLGYGSTTVAEDGKTITINSDATREWLDFVLNTMYAADIFPPDAFEWDNASNNAAYQNESAISIHNPASVLVWMLENKPDLAAVTAIQSVPAGPQGQFNSAGIRLAWAMFNTSPQEKQDLGADLLRYLMAPEQYEPWIALAFAAPPVAQYETMEIWQDPQKAGFLEGAKTGVLSGHPGPVTPAASELGTRNPSLTMVLRTVIDGWSIEEAVAEAEQVALDVYSKYE
jgi:ABC-type glycerol-3-phosphate transport system substrate-binding protein